MKSFIALSLLFATQAFAGFTIPELKNPVNDYANVLTPAGKEAIATQIVQLKQETKAQLGVLIVSTLDGDNLEEASIRSAKAWKLGNKADSDGILLFVVVNDRKMRIEVGQGLEGTVTDARSKQILGSMKSFLRSKDYNGAIMAGVSGISDIIKSGAADIQHNNITPSTPAPESNTLWIWLLAGLGIVGLVVFLVYKESERQAELDREANKQYREDLKRHQSYVASMEKQGKTAHKPAPKKPRKSDDDDSSSRSSTYVGIFSGGSSDSGSSWSSGGSSDSGSSGSDWGGGGGDFSGGGSSDSW